MEDILTIAALIGVTWSAKEFVQARRSEREAFRLKQTSEWRKQAVHEILMNSEQFLSTGEITSRLRGNSFDNALRIEKDELSEASVRKVLMEMVGEGTIGQVFPDRYGVVQIPRDITVNAIAENIQGNRAARSGYAEIAKHPGRYTSDELFEEIGKNFGLPKSDFGLAILVLETNNAAARDADGKWSPKKSKDI